MVQWLNGETTAMGIYWNGETMSTVKWQNNSNGEKINGKNVLMLKCYFLLTSYISFNSLFSIDYLCQRKVLVICILVISHIYHFLFSTFFGFGFSYDFGIGFWFIIAFPVIFRFVVYALIFILFFFFVLGLNVV